MSELPELSINGFEQRKCSSCYYVKPCLQFKCQESFCGSCLFEHFRRVVSNTSKVLNENWAKLNGRFTYLGCPHGCAASGVSVPPSWVSSLLEIHGEQELASTAQRLSGFFSGIPTYFLFCDHCQKLSISPRPQDRCPCKSPSS